MSPEATNPTVRSFVLIPLRESTLGPCCPFCSSNLIVMTVGQWEPLHQPHVFVQGGLFSPKSHMWVVVGCLPAAPCLQPMDEGSCRHYTLRWYFHPAAKACRPFIFGGCQGNSNRFETKRKCERLCKISAGEKSTRLSDPPPRRKQENTSRICPPPLPYGVPPRTQAASCSRTRAALLLCFF